MDLIEFIPEYPDISDPAFFQGIYEKKEFYDLRDRKLEGGFFSHQKIIARFISSWTLYHSLFLIHDTGTGKSGSAAAVFDGLIRNRPRMETLYLSKNETLLDNFRSEVIRRSPVLNAMWKHLTEKIAIDENNFNLYRNRVLKEARIQTYTYARFASMFQKSRELLAKQFQSGLIIMDEVHHLVISDVQKTTVTAKTTTGKVLKTEETVPVYKEIHAFLHSLAKRKLLMMTATPMRYSPVEIAPLFNLIFPRNEQFPVGKQFEQEYFSRKERKSVVPSLEWKKGKEARFKQKTRGLVSVVKQNPDVAVTFVGKSYLPMHHFKIAAHQMSPLQTRVYQEAVARDKADAKKKKGEEGPMERRESSVYTHAVQASLMVFPNGSYGRGDKTREYFSKDKNKSLTSAFFQQGQLKFKATTDEQILHNLEKIREWSTTYYEILKHILTKPNELVYVYCDRIQGSGIWACVRLLVQCFQYRLVKNSKNFYWGKPQKQCIFLNDTQEGTTKTDIMNLINIFNDFRNRTGDYIQVIFGTDKTREGITLKNIKQIHITTADWNFGKIYQAIGRGVRLLSHEALGTDVTVDIFFHCAVPGREMPKGSLAPLEEETSVVEQESKTVDVVESPLVEEEEEDPLASLNEPLEDGSGVPDLSSEKEGSDASSSSSDSDLSDIFKDLGPVLEVPEEPTIDFSADQLMNSLDFYKYYRSELRDKNIKLVEYAFLTSAFDCQLNFNENYRSKGKDYTPECMYQPCLYRCDGIRQIDIPEKQLDQSTFNLYYLPATMSSVVPFLQGLFQETMGYHLDHLIDLAHQQGYTSPQVFEALDRIVSKPLSISYRDGRTLFVTRRGDYFFLIDDRQALSWVEDPIFFSYYTKVPTFHVGVSYDTLNEQFLLHQQPFEQFLSTLLQHQDEEGVRLFALLPDTEKTQLQTEVLRVLNGRETTPRTKEWAKWAQEHLFSKDLLKTSGGVYVVKHNGTFWTFNETTHSLVPSQHKPGVPAMIEQQEPGKVEKPKTKISEVPTDHSATTFVEKYIRDNPFKVFAFHEKGQFKIRDVSRDETTIKDSKDQTKGKVCTSFRISQMLYYLSVLGLTFPSEKPTVKPERWESIQKLVSKDLKDEVQKKQALAKEWIDLVKKPWTDDLQKFFLYYSLLGKKELCLLLEHLFQTKDLLVPPPLAKDKKK